MSICTHKYTEFFCVIGKRIVSLYLQTTPTHQVLFYTNLYPLTRQWPTLIYLSIQIANLHLFLKTIGYKPREINPCPPEWHIKVVLPSTMGNRIVSWGFELVWVCEDTCKRLDKKMIESNYNTRFIRTSNIIDCIDHKCTFWLQL